MALEVRFPILTILSRIFTAAVVLSLCSCNRNEHSASDLAARASQAASKARLYNEEHPQDTLKLYEDARELVEAIFAEYGSTKIAKQLQSGAATLDGMTVKELRTETIPKFRLMLKAMSDPMQLVQALIPHVPAALAQSQLAQMLVDKLIKAHKSDEALQQIKVALRGIDDIKSFPDQIAILLNLAKNYSELGIKDKTLELTFRALTLAKQIPILEVRQNILSEIALSYYRTGAEQKGFEAVRSIQDTRKEQESLRALANRLGQENLFTEALAVTRAIRDGPDKALFLMEIASQAVDQELCESVSPFTESATRLADTFSDRNEEAWLWLRMATLMHRCGKDVESLSILDKAVQASGEGSRNVNLRATATLMSALADAYADLGQNETSFSLITSALPIAQKERSQEERDRILVDLSICLTKLGEYERSEKILSSIKTFREFARSRVARAKLYYKKGKTDEALSLLSAVKEKVVDQTDTEERTSTLLALRDSYFDLGRLNEALSVGFLLHEYGESWRKHIRTLNEHLVSHGEVSLALRLAREIHDPYLAGVLLTDIARYQAGKNLRNEAIALMEEAFRVTRSGLDSKRTGAMTQYFAEALLLMQFPQEAYDLVSSNDLANKPLWYSRIATCFFELGKQEEAASTLATALSMAADVQPLESQLQALIEVAAAYSSTGIQPNANSQRILRGMFEAGMQDKTG